MTPAPSIGRPGARDEEGREPGRVGSTVPSSPQLSGRTAAVTLGGQLAGKAALLAVALAGTAVVTRALGVRGYATWGTVLSLLTMFGFALDPGLAPVIVRRLSQGDSSLPGPASFLRVRLVLAAAVYTCVTVLTVVLRGLAGLPVALVMAAQLFPRVVVQNAGTWLQAHHRLHRQSAYEVLTQLGGLGALAVGAVLSLPAAGLAAMGFFAPAVVLAGLMERQLGKVVERRSTPKDDHGARDALRAVIREAAPVAGATLLVSIYFRIDIFFVTPSETTAGLASYLLAYRFIEQAVVVAGILATTLMPMLAVRALRVALVEDRATSETLVAVAALGAGCAASMIGLAAPLTDLVGGPAFQRAVLLLALLAPTVAGVFLNFFLGYLFMSLQKAKRYLWINAVGLMVNVAGNSLFTLSSGAASAARVSYVTELVVVTLAAAPLARSGSRGAVVKALGIYGTAISGAEGYAAGWFPASIAAGGIFVATGALAARELLASGRRLRKGRPAV